MNNLVNKILGISSLLITIVTGVLAQMPKRPVPGDSPTKQVATVPNAVQSEGDSTLYYVVLFLLIVGLIGALGWWYKTKKSAKDENESEDKKKKKNSWDMDSVDADKEMEWLRKHSKTFNKRGRKKKSYPDDLPKTSKVLNKNKAESLEGNVSDVGYAETKAKLDKIKFDKLPINAFTGVNPAKEFDALPISNDAALISAIEQTQDEYEEDEAIRDLAIRILARFKTRNSIEALSQVALYDLSAPLRSKAITTLAEFDHESVFETILLGCADPTREVRAAAARALFQLNFNRADAWARIAQSEDEYRISQAAKAAIESDLVDRSIERLVHEDYKYSYEAFTLLALLVKANETKEIFQALENHRDKLLKLAILRVLQVLQDERVLKNVYSYMERNSLPEDLSNAAMDVVKSCDLVSA